MILKKVIFVYFASDSLDAVFVSGFILDPKLEKNTYKHTTITQNNIKNIKSIEYKSIINPNIRGAIIHETLITA